ncbi:hypothetical protein ACIP4S_41080 [Streptomyces chartreusis]|uniref:hypothetical protein n=1 Tax=Streptomyces chartreusis TaxID=1969 RepID=UPI003803E5BD
MSCFGGAGDLELFLFRARVMSVGAVPVCLAATPASGLCLAAASLPSALCLASIEGA